MFDKTKGVFLHLLECTINLGQNAEEIKECS